MSVDGVTANTFSHQLKDNGSIPISALQFYRVGLRSVGPFIRQHHYSKTYPGGIDYCFAASYQGRIVGACAFGYMAGNPKGMVICDGVSDPSSYRELMRLVFVDEVEKNAESRFIGYCLRWLKKHTALVAVISFADPKYGHLGIVYQSTNWIYTGLQKPDRDRIILQRTDLFGDYQQEIHPRQAVNKFGSSARDAVGMATFTKREPKHRYVHILRPGHKCIYQSKPYPKFACPSKRPTPKP